MPSCAITLAISSPIKEWRSSSTHTGSGDTAEKAVAMGRQVGFVFDSEDTDGFLSEARTRFDVVLLA